MFNMKTSTLLLLMLSLGGPAFSQVADSGLAIGKDCPAFDPYHMSGPDKGTRACPMCKYGSRQGIMVWVNNDDWTSLSVIAQRLESEIDRRGLKELRAFIIYMNPDQRPMDQVMKTLTDLSRDAKLDKVAVTCIPGPADPKSAKLFQINADKEIKNTVFVYKSRKVFEKFINLDAARDLDKLLLSFEKTLKSKSL